MILNRYQNRMDRACCKEEKSLIINSILFNNITHSVLKQKLRGLLTCRNPLSSGFMCARLFTVMRRRLKRPPYLTL